jgi:peptide/nickel transport system substrate-binding protein
MVYDSDTATYEPRVAESLTPNADFTQWRLTLRTGVEYGNGDALTAEDVRTSILRHQSADNAQASRGEAATIAQMNVVDSRTVDFTTTDAYPQFAHVLATDVGMITNPRVVDALGPEQFANDPTGAGVGPYELERYSPGVEIVLKAKDNYWGGPVCITTLRFVSIAGAQSTFEALSNGELDVALLRDPIVIDRAKSDGFVSLPTLFNYGEGVVMNSAEGRPTSDIDVRRAVVAAVDPDMIDQRVFNGTANATSAFIADGTPTLFDGVEGPASDPERAQQLVEDAKAKGWSGAIRLVADNSSTRISEAIAIEAQLEAVGFDVQLDTSLGLPELISRVAVDRDYDLAIWGPNYTTEGLWSLMNRQLKSGSPSNYYGYSDERLDTELTALRRAETDEETRAIVARMQEVFIDNPFIANIAAYEEDNVHSPNIGGLILNRASVLRYDKAFVEGR